MGICFDSLPSERPNPTKEVGFYMATISNAEMKVPKNQGKPYLCLTYDLVDKAGKSAGKLWDNFVDVEKELPRYKLQRLVNAVCPKLTGEFELKDLTKLVVGKKLVDDIGIDEKSDQPRNQVEVFKHEIYYPAAEWAALQGVQGAPKPAVEDSLPFDPVSAPDALDAQGVQDAANDSSEY
jgi:hypothetical protein